MPEFRWLLFAVGLAVFALIFWWTRREASGRSVIPPSLLPRKFPRLGPDPEHVSSGSASSGGTSRQHDSVAAPVDPQRIIAIRLTGQASATFAGEALFMALREAGLRHGRFGIFHRHDTIYDDTVIFSVASLVEPGSFDLTTIRTDRFPGVTFFLPLPAPRDNVAAFDDMLSTARTLAARLEGQLLDEQGSRLSVQRERFLREEVIQFQHKRQPG